MHTFSYFSAMPRVHTRKKKETSTLRVTWKEHMQQGGMENTGIKKIKPIHCNKKKKH